MPFATFFKRWFAKGRTPATRDSFRPRLEILEDRWCPSGVGQDVYEQAGIGTFSNPINLGPAVPGVPLHFSQSRLSINSSNPTEWFKFSLIGSSTAADLAVVQFMDGSVAPQMHVRLFTNGAASTLQDNPPPNLSLSGLSAGTYLVHVSNDGDGAYGYYTLSMDISPADNNTPYNLTPLNNTTISTVTPTFTWSPVPGASQFIFQLTDTTTNTYVGIPATSNSLSRALLSGHTYQWYVDAHGQSGLLGTSPTFTVSVLAPDANEPNNTLATAISLGFAAPTAPLAYSTSASIYQATDVDFYSIDINPDQVPGDNATMTVDHTQGNLNMVLYYAGDLSTPRRTSTSSGPNGSSPGSEYLDLTNLVGALYVIKVQSTNNIANKYVLNVTLHEVRDPFPTLNAPGTNGQVLSLRPSLSWSYAAGAVSYQVWIDDLSSGASNLFPGATATTNSWAPPANLVGGDTYRWWARGYDRNNNPLPWSYSQDFTVATAVFTPVFAMMGGTIPDENPTITWTGLRGPSYYSIWVNNVTTGAANIFPNTKVYPVSVANPLYLWNALYNSSFLVPGNTYTIWVQANGQGAWSAGPTFTIGTIAFAKPQTALANLQPSIPFTSIYGAFGAMYELDDLTSGKTDLFPGQPLTGNTWTPPSPLTLGHSYRLWGKVSGPSQASFNSGIGWWGPGVDFTINTSITPLAGPAPTLRPTLSWDALAGVANYEVYVADNAGGGNLTPGVIVNTNRWTPTFDLVSGDSYTMWVRVQNGPWSAGQTFQIATVSEFGGNSTFIPPFGPPRYVKWTPLTGAKDYVLWLTDVTTGAVNLFPDQVINQPATVGTLSAQWQLPDTLDISHTYKLWVKARNKNDQGSWSSAFTFTPSQFM